MSELTTMKYMDIKEFREKGFLQEVNRQFLHPLGLALSVDIDDEGKETLSSIWDYRDDPEGVAFGPGMIDLEKAAEVEELRLSKDLARAKLFGKVIQDE